MSEIKNAIISNIQITKADHDILTAWLNFDFGDYQQGFGGYTLYSPRFGDSKFSGRFIWRVMEITDVLEGSQLKGNAIRVRMDNDKIKAIGHIIREDWFCPDDEV